MALDLKLMETKTIEMLVNQAIENKERIERLEEENKLVKDILYSILNSLREIEDMSDFSLCNLDKDTFKDFYKLEELIDERNTDD